MFHRSYFHLAAAASLAVALFSAAASAQEAINRDPSAVQPGAYTVEPNHTRVLFAVSHLGFTTWYGEFTKVSGMLSLSPKGAELSTLEIRIPTASVSTSNAKLDDELRSADWFDAARYPDIYFKAIKVARTGADTADVIGDLFFHGVTKPITLKAKFNASGINMIDKHYTVGFEVAGRLTRSDFGVKTYVPVVGDEVTLIISAAFVK